MAEKKVTPYGSWQSPITTDLIVSETIRLGLVTLEGNDTYWIEGRPSEGGRNVVVCRKGDGTMVDVNPLPLNARTRVHEYGGGDYVVHNGTVYFANFADQRLYRVEPSAEPTAITPAVDMRYADLIIDHQRNRLICVCEDHTDAEREETNMLVSFPLDGDGGMEILVAGNDFYATPRLSPDGSRLAWLTWNHPNMPWDGCELWVAQLNEQGCIERKEQVAGGLNESIFQPSWSDDGVLYFISDRTNWWNLYRWHNGNIEPLCPRDAEFGVPHWVFGQSTYAFVSPQRLVCLYEDLQGEHLCFLDAETGTLTPIELPYTVFGSIHANAERIVLIAASPTEPSAVIEIDVVTTKSKVLRRSSAVTVDPAFISIAQRIEFPTEYGQTAYAYYYEPCNANYQASKEELPPLLVISHGGPTSSTSNTLNMQIQFWTSRGFAVLDVDYGGSTGYGREYRERLKGQWGVVDVNDCVNGVKYVVSHGLVDEKRLAIRGGSSGGYTTLCALTFTDIFSAGASHFGISNLEVFVHDTHKFESRYLNSLVGPFPEKRDIYYQRSAINYTNQLSCPVIFFQGLEDKIVPPNQTEIMVEALRAKRLPVAYLAFEGEQHGFRRAENIKRSLEVELYFYSKVFKFDLPEYIEPITIENL
jgi:dipeptidyl aminopeptidase/acylaminoacyl peptidase